MNAMTDPALLQPTVGVSLVDLYQQGGSLPDISNEVYHADRSCISVSGLKQLLRSPAHYQSYLTETRKETPALFYGTAIHARLLEPEVYARTYIGAYNLDKRKKDYAEFEVMTAGLRILSRDQMTAIERINENVMAHASARALLRGGTVEQTLIWQDEETGVWLKIRPDCLNFDFGDGICVDVKSTDDASGAEFPRSCVKYDYDLQAAVYLDGLRAVYKRDFDFAFLAVEKDGPYGVALYGAPEEMLERGRRRFRQALQLLVKCRDTGSWPCYQQDGGYEILDWPRYAK
jgi:hypothetical protein